MTDPELRWPGKYDAAGRRAAPRPGGLALQVDQRVGAGGDDLLICGDNLRVMDALLATHAGRLDLVYLDPPFSTGQSFTRTSFVGPDGEGRGELRSRAYDDRWPGGLAGFLRMLDPRLQLVHRLLAPHGSLYVHVDPTVGHYVKVLLDEIFGPACFQREIVWRIGWLSGFKTRAHNWIRNHDLIFFYTRDPARFTFHKHYVPHPEGYRRRDGAPPRGRGVAMEDVWNASPAEFALRGRDSLDSIQIKSFSREKTGWATQKNESLLRRIVAASSSPGDLVADFFCGSGTTLVAAHALGRRFLGCDSAAPAVELAHTRLAADPSASFDRCSLGLAERRAWLAAEDDRTGRAGAPASAARPTVATQAAGADASAAPASAARPPSAPRDPSNRPPAPLDLVHLAHVLRHRGAAATDPPLHGVVDGLGVLVGPCDAPLTRAAVDLAVAAAAARGLRGLDLLAWSWAFPADADLSHGTGLDITQLQLRRELLDERVRPGEALGERPHFLLEWEPLPGRAARLVVRGAALRHPARLDPALQPALAGPAELVELWSLEFAAAGPVFRPDERHARTRSRRDLALASAAHVYPGPGPYLARVELVDRLGAAHRLAFTLDWRAGELHAVPADDPTFTCT
jgi:DNA modification methylase